MASRRNRWQWRWPNHLVHAHRYIHLRRQAINRIQTKIPFLWQTPKQRQVYLSQRQNQHRRKQPWQRLPLHRMVKIACNARFVFAKRRCPHRRHRAVFAFGLHVYASKRLAIWSAWCRRIRVHQRSGNGNTAWQNCFRDGLQIIFRQSNKDKIMRKPFSSLCFLPQPPPKPILLKWAMPMAMSIYVPKPIRKAVLSRALATVLLFIWCRQKQNRLWATGCLCNTATAKTKSKTAGCINRACEISPSSPPWATKPARVVFLHQSARATVCGNG